MGTVTKRADIKESEGVPVLDCEEGVIDYIYDNDEREYRAGSHYDEGIFEVKHDGIWAYAYTIDFDFN